MKNRSYQVKICQNMLEIGQVALKICKNTSFLPKFSHMYQFSDRPPRFNKCEVYIPVPYFGRFGLVFLGKSGDLKQFYRFCKQNKCILYISILKHIVLLLLYENSRPNFDKNLPK